jgi:TolB-like protein/DNA-binding winged helix-turn-helix (wHTH) protein/Tfp pilus assembly protein PilF
MSCSRYVRNGLRGKAFWLIVLPPLPQGLDVSTSAQSSSRLRFDGFEVDLCSREVWKHGRRVRLQEQPFQVLLVLLERPGQIVTRDELKQTLWPADTFVDFDDGLNTAVKKIRELLGDSAERPRYIETIPRRGYRFVGSIALPSPVEATVPAPSLRPALILPTAEVAGWGRAARPTGYAVVGVLALVVVLVGAVGGWRARLVGHAAAPRIESLAVLPLANLSHDPGQDYFADGMTEALIANLAQVRALRVISRTSAMHYKGTHLTLPQIVRELNVDAVIEGTVQRSGNHVRVSAQLIRGQTDAPVWAKIYERDSDDVLVMQSEIAQAVISEIRVQLTPQERQRFAGGRPVNPKAYDAYLLGDYLSRKRNSAAMEKAIEYFQEAIRIDPSYAQAYAGLAGAYSERDVWSGVGVGKTADQVRANTLKALELDGELPEAHSLLGWIYFQYDWDWMHTEAEFKRAIELNANLPSSYARYAFFLQAMGRHQEALAAVHRAVELDPLSAWNISEEGRILYRARRYADAVARYQRALELDPGYLPALSRIAEAYAQLGKYDEALAWAQKYQQISGDPSLGMRLMASIYARTGKRHEAEEALRTIEKNGDVDEYGLAVIYSALGDHDRAIAEVEKLVQKRSAMPFVFVGPELDSLRSDPRFQQLLRPANLPS